MISKYNPSPKVYISKSKIQYAGRGVFAAQDIQKGEIIEKCPYIQIPKDEVETITNSVFVNYIYFFGKNKERMLLALGYGSIYNHSYSPNSKYKIIANKELIEFSAIKYIEKDEEIIVNYNQESPDSKPLWFE